MKTYKMPMQNKSVYEISSKSDNGKDFKNRGKARKRTHILTDVEKPRYTQKWPCLRLRNFISKRNFDTGFEISSVGIPEISPYTKSEQPSIAGKHLTRHAKNGYAVVAT